MSDSETSSDMKVKYENSNGENLLEDKNITKKVQSSDTDYYFNIIANPSKVIQKKNIDLESSDFNNIINENHSDTSKSSKSSIKNIRSEISNHSESSRSREKYEKININQSQNQPITETKINQPQIETKIKQPVQQTQATQHIQQPQLQPTQQPQLQPTQQHSFINIQKSEIKELSPSDIRMKKIELLRKLSEIKSKGYQLSKEYDFNSSLDEMEYEYDLLRSFADKRNGVKVFKSGLLQAVSLIEFLNDKYDPFDFHLSGWGDHMQVETESWDDVLEEIYEKYKGTGKKVAPEVRILLLFVASASAFHFTKSQSANLPGLDSLLASNPGLLSKIINPSKGESSQFMSPQEINIEKQRVEIKKNQNNIRLQPVQQPTKVNNQQPYSAFGNSSPSIRAPEQVKDILSRIHNLQPSNIKMNTETQDETSSNNDRIISESTLSDTSPSKKKYNRKPKKSGISII